jgi:tryptophan synthase alpha chain
MLELGVPFSDPTADGPVIARASARSIARGGGLETALQAARAIREKSTIPLVLFGYYNPLFVRGEAKTVQEAKAAGIDAFLVVDLPLDEAGPLRTLLAAEGMSFVPLLAPTSSPQRVDTLQAASKQWPGGFVYYVSVTGVTGSGVAPLAEASEQAARLRAATQLPTIVGFGVDSREKARMAASQADGVAVGTALVKGIEAGATAEGRRMAVEAVCREIRLGLDDASASGG